MAEKFGSGVNGVLDGKTEEAYTKAPVEAAPKPRCWAIAAVVRDRSGAPAAAWWPSSRQRTIDFTQLGFVDLSLVSWMGFLLFALSLAMLVFISRLRKKFPRPTPPDPTVPTPGDFTAGSFEPTPELPEPSEPAGGNFDPMTGEPLDQDPPAPPEA